MEESILNFNIGLLGHVDSGKTSLAKSLSTIASTAAFDKNPQSQERGITIDLGFSSFCADAPIAIVSSGYSKVQFTLVDCPGHASLIRTIIGGAQIIDAMMLVIDITKGLQTQTAECLIIGEILCKDMIVILNKVDLVPKEKRKTTIEKMTKRILNTLKNTKFSNAKVVSVAACPAQSENCVNEAIGMDELIISMKQMVYLPVRHEDKPFVFSVDHCFGIRGQGTVITGTVLQGSIKVNETIEIPIMKMSRKIKSLQVFRKPVLKAIQGDRVGMCVTQFDPKHLERSLVGITGYIPIVNGFIAEVCKISYYKHSIASKSKFHVSLGHDTVLANVTFFGLDQNISDSEIFNVEKEYFYQSELMDPKTEELTEGYKPLHQFALIEFERPVPLVMNSVFIASKLDIDIHTSTCRLSFWGTVTMVLLQDYKESLFPRLKVFKDKSREGMVERLNNEDLIVKNFLKKGTDIQLFCGMKVKLSTGEEGIIDGYFGQSGKVKVRISNELKPETKAKLKAISDSRKKGKKEKENEVCEVIDKDPIKVYLNFKKYMFNSTKKLIQT